MPSGPGNGRDDVFTDLGGQRLELIVAEAAQFAGSLQGGQDGQLHTLLWRPPSNWTTPFVCRAVYRACESALLNQATTLQGGP
jgi:hypothetical protein